MSDLVFEDRPVLHLVGIETSASNDRADLIGAHWQRFHAEGIPGRVLGREGRAVVAVYSEYEGDHTQPYTFFLGCPVGAGAATPEGLARRELPAGPYARFDAVGEQPGALVQTWMGIWSSGFERSFVADYEIHDPDDPSRVVIYVN